MNLFLRIILCVFGIRNKSGTLLLSTGAHDIDIRTHWRPKEVWIRQLCVSPPTCSDSRDSIEITIKRHGFTVKANIESNHRKIQWFVIG